MQDAAEPLLQMLSHLNILTRGLACVGLEP